MIVDKVFVELLEYKQKTSLESKKLSTVFYEN